MCPRRKGGDSAIYHCHAQSRRSLTSGHCHVVELANSDVSVYTLMKLLGHESMVTAQRYVTAAGTETRAAAAQNRLYRLLTEGRKT
jgi:integrase